MMTLKEFKSALRVYGLPVEVFGYEAILNQISLLYGYQADDADKKGQTALYRDYIERASGIYDILNARGFYDKYDKKEVQ